MYTLVILLVTVRFFTETVVVLPRVFNAIDIAVVPLVGALALANVLGSRRDRVRGAWLLVLLLMFLGSTVAGWLSHESAVEPVGGAMFFVGHAIPMVFYLAVINLNLRADAPQSTIRLFMWLLLINGVIGAWQAVANGGATKTDFVLGTFGVNTNQMAFFLAICMTYLIAKARYQGIERRQVVLLLWTTPLFLLCAFQTMWVILPIATGLGLVLVRVGGARRKILRLRRRFLLTGVVAALLPPILLALVPTQRFELVATLSRLPEILPRTGKAYVARALPTIWAEDPLALLIGVGPGTFNSRAFRNVADIQYDTGKGGVTDVAAAIREKTYRSALADRYVVSWFDIQNDLDLRLGSDTAGPWTSYLALLAEGGVIGGAAVLLMYLGILRLLLRRARRQQTVFGRTLLGWATMNVFMLLGIALVDNYLEVTRYTLLVALSVAVADIATRPSQEAGEAAVVNRSVSLA